MRTSLFNRPYPALRLAALTLAIAMTPWALARSQTQPTQPAPSQPDQSPSERFWLAGRYDGNRIIVYFDAVKFGDTLSSNSNEIAPPIATGFFSPVRVPEAFAIRLQKAPNAERFVVGDKYDLLFGEDVVRTVTLTTIVGAETDEGVGNDSFIGALAMLDKEDVPLLMKDYYVLRRHRGRQNDNKETNPAGPQAAYAGLQEGAVRFDVQTQIVDLLTQRMKTLATSAQRYAAEHVSPIVEVQAFHLPDGGLRYYASTFWNSGAGSNDTSSYALAAWIAPEPTLHIVAVEPRTFGYVLDEPKLLNVVDLGAGKTGMIVEISAGESIETDLFEYRDCVELKHMRMLQSIGAGE